MSDTTKRARSAQIDDEVWGMFEYLSQDLELSVDYLIFDAMKMYAREYEEKHHAPSTGYQPATSGQVPSPQPAPEAAEPAQRAEAPTRMPPPPRRPPPPKPSAPPAASSAYPLSSGASPPAYAASGGYPSVPGAYPAPSGAYPGAATGGYPAPPPPQSMVPATRATPAAQAPYGRPPEPPPPPPAGAARLYIYYQNERHEIPDRFVIGRGSKGVDLTVRDPNVSRQHVMVEKLHDKFYIVDMGSTNGIEFHGNRVQRKELGDGDLIDLCGHELRFAYE